ncbi:esterase/lipase family protein [Rhodococcus sp. NPDC058514]|uniref:esterase/lipase family protein n=1 Tax=unclassified Rhodococcus (in: high G+C Gram-positive bacteria) TaxID=192944 RepID=UPI00365ABAF8
MKARLRVAVTSVATVALFALGTAIVPSATASAQSSSTGSAGDQDPPQGELAGANDWSCVPSERHPRPVVLVHGTGMTMQSAWGNLKDSNLPGPLIKSLRDDGYCVFALNYGFAAAHFLGPTGIRDPLVKDDWGHAAIEDSARELAEFIESVRERTGSQKVDVVGHSQGGTLARQYLRFAGGAGQQNPANNKVHALVMLGPSTHGTTYWGYTPAIAKLWGSSVAMQQQTTGSEFLTDLNTQETLPGIEYTVIATTKDDRILPYHSSFLKPAPGTEQSVHKMTVQDRCGNPNLAVLHSRTIPGIAGTSTGLLDHAVPLFLVRQALDPDLPGTPAC